MIFFAGVFKMKRRDFLILGASASALGGIGGKTVSNGRCLDPDDRFFLENEHFSLTLSRKTGALSSFFVKRNRSELIGENRLIANFRICLPLPEYQCNYIDGMANSPVKIERAGNSIIVGFSGLSSPNGTFPLNLDYTITLDGDEVRFHARLANASQYPVSEFWFPRLGGWTGFNGRDALAAIPGYVSCRHETSLFRGFPRPRPFGGEAAEYSVDYPGMVMPWIDMYDTTTDTGLYFGYHDRIFRYSTWHLYLFPDNSGRPEDAWLSPAEACGEPVGLVFSHVRYPFISAGETYDTGDFIIRVHEGDWHKGSGFYRRWFMENFPFDKSGSWLRRQSAWFSSIIYQPEDRIVADYETYNRWCRDAEGLGINCHELIGWQKGGLERGYPEYYPEEKLGGREGYRRLLGSIKSRGKRCLTFVNYNILDSSTEDYPKKYKPLTHQDQYGNTPNWMAWGESTLLARKSLSVHRHVLASVVPELRKILEGYFLDRVRDGADAFQIDKMVVGSALDFNPMNTLKPDEALCEGMVQAIGELLAKCREINPDFCLASECVQDRMLPYIDVYYRNVSGSSIAPLRYVFPEWTAVAHISAPRDFRGINGAVLTGAVICMEPDCYQNTLADPKYRDLGNYLREVERIRHELGEIIFLGNYFEATEASVDEIPPSGGEMASGALRFAVHGDRKTNRRAMVVINNSRKTCAYRWKFEHRIVRCARVYAPFQEVRDSVKDAVLEIKPDGLHIILEEI